MLGLKLIIDGSQVLAGRSCLLAGAALESGNATPLLRLQPGTDLLWTQDTAGLQTSPSHSLVDQRTDRQESLVDQTEREKLVHLNRTQRTHKATNSPEGPPSACHRLEGVLPKNTSFRVLVTETHSRAKAKKQDKISRTQEGCDHEPGRFNTLQALVVE